jgi:predicted regulator of Ras-like GTPase activity (Roadblock/LC7/MglB family)
MTLEGIGPVAANYDITTASEIVAVGAISVLAGDYAEAMRVDSSTQMVITGKAGDISIPPIEFEFQTTTRHVKHVGLVKSEMVDQMGAFTGELLSIESTPVAAQGPHHIASPPTSPWPSSRGLGLSAAHPAFP